MGSLESHLPVIGSYQRMNPLRGFEMDEVGAIVEGAIQVAMVSEDVSATGSRQAWADTTGLESDAHKPMDRR